MEFKIEQMFQACKQIDNEDERTKCLWNVIYNTERFVDEVRKFLPRRNDTEVLSSIIAERCVDITREVAKGMKELNPTLIDFGYVWEKVNKLNYDVKELEKTIQLKRTRF